ncbi:hypothetical protein [Vibrio mediterranei]|uniref:Uncharacterized protein n=1 Tax=Vibrio mediterranei TaxID=689 RepID=A0ABX5D9Z7_9VIBR|nr:hypothetical protein [Vibrio mediterranei]PCD85628.1 hypothetical protein COR52_25705 [Vibrio mediterranei]PRQ66507.1 hypothetical protein COR51_16360 [Vibrio mediterranei]
MKPNLALLTALLASALSSTTVTAKVTLADAYASEQAITDSYNASTVNIPKEGIDVRALDPVSGLSNTPIIYNGVSGSSCTNVRPPSGASVRTHDVYINGVYEDQTNHEASHTRGVAQQLTHDGDTRICAAWTHARHYNFTYEIKAYKK